MIISNCLLYIKIICVICIIAEYGKRWPRNGVPLFWDPSFIPDL